MQQSKTRGEKKLTGVKKLSVKKSRLKESGGSKQTKVSASKRVRSDTRAGKENVSLKSGLRAGAEGPRRMRRRGGKRGKTQRRKLRLLKEQGFFNRTKATNIIHRVHHQQKVLATARRRGQAEEVKKLKKKMADDNLMPEYQKACFSAPLPTSAVDDQVFSRNQTTTFNSTEWILQEMRFHKLLDSNLLEGGRGYVRLLDVGSMTNPYVNMKRVRSVCLDPNPCGPQVEQLDLLSFFKKWKQEEKKKRFDCIALCLVLNFEGDPKLRGKMLIAATSMLRDRGILLFSLPRSCTSNSRFCTKEILLGQLKAIGLKALRAKSTTKLSLWVLQKRKEKFLSWKKEKKKNKKMSEEKKIKVLRQGEGRNNFKIVF